jgi:chaperone BCS1
MVIQFKLATKNQARNLFTSTYRKEPGVTVLADKFAEQIPENSLSPASLQNFLVSRKDDPAKAVREIKNWVSDTIGKEP